MSQKGKCTFLNYIWNHSKQPMLCKQNIWLCFRMILFQDQMHLHIQTKIEITSFLSQIYFIYKSKFPFYKVDKRNNPKYMKIKSSNLFWFQRKKIYGVSFSNHSHEKTRWMYSLSQITLQIILRNPTLQSTISK